MSVSVIVLGSNPNGRLTEADIKDSLGGGIVYVSCTNGCANTSRLTIDTAGTAKKYDELASAELKPSEVVVVKFSEEADLEKWLNARASKLVGKAVFVVRPSVDIA